MNRKVLPILKSFSRRYCGTKENLSLHDIRIRRNELFTEEKSRQQSLISRIEKIQVEFKGPPEECSLLMNKHVSTPYNVAMHIQELLTNRSVIALVNGQPWDMNKPLVEDCEVSFLHFHDDDPYLSNVAFWRTGSFVLGYVLETAFKEEYNVELCSFPAPRVKSGSFVYDVDLKINGWKPTQSELNCLSRIGSRLGFNSTKFERLEVDVSVAQNIFKYNRFKSAQIPGIAEQSKDGSTVVLYRMGDHVDITKGPLISTTQLLNKYSVVAFHEIESPDFGPLTRVQGLAMPSQIRVHYWTYDFLCERAAKLNNATIPQIRLPERTTTTSPTSVSEANGF